MVRSCSLAAALVLLGACAPRPGLEGASTGLEAPAFPTPAEACDYRCTSTYDEVMSVVGRVTRAAPDLHATAFGQSVEGRDLPLVVWGAPGPGLEAVRATGKTRVLVFANIHAGEVAGKDGLLELLRAVAAGEHDAWSDSLVVLFAPIYNADGNERVAHDNRPLQLGPVEGMGVRRNAQDLDLNRDFMKLAAPESRALVGLIRDADPHVVVDLHTTNGTKMGYHLTYAPGLAPATPPAVDAELWDRWLPAISDSLLARDDFAAYHYGNVPGAFGEEASAPRGWYSFSGDPRFSTNYVGLRGRYGILSEAYSYAPYRERVAVSRRFVEEILEAAWADAVRVRRTAEAADADRVVGREVAIRATWEALPEPVDILLGAVDTVAHPATGAPMLERRAVREPERMPAYVRFGPAETVTAPRAYVVTGAAVEAVRPLLEAHGVSYSEGDPAGPRQAFRLDAVETAERPYEGVRMVSVEGAWVEAPSAGAGLVVPVDQPLGRLVVSLLEPRASDGVVAWGVVGLDGSVPIQRIPAP